MNAESRPKAALKISPRQGARSTESVSVWPGVERVIRGRARPLVLHRDPEMAAALLTEVLGPDGAHAWALDVLEALLGAS